jgi:ribosome-associated protein
MTKSNLDLENKINTINQTGKVSSEQLAWTIAAAADDRQAGDIVLLKVEEMSYLTDYFVIVTGFSKAQVRAISEAIAEKVAQQLHKHPLRIEGKSEANWVLHDYGDVIAHIFLPQAREFYDLEAFWGRAEKINFSPNLKSTENK